VEIAVRVTALWLSAASAILGTASLYLQSRLFWPDFYDYRALADSGSLLVVAAAAAALALRSSCLTPGTLTALAVGHLTAAIETRAVLAICPTCMNLTQSIDDWPPTDTGPLWLFGPSLAVVVACAIGRRVTSAAA
jgi:hypothetical protein